MRQVLGLLIGGVAVFVLWAVVAGEDPLAVARDVLTGRRSLAGGTVAARPRRVAVA